jgi:hypothetical protein
MPATAVSVLFAGDEDCARITADGDVSKTTDSAAATARDSVILIVA